MSRGHTDYVAVAPDVLIVAVEGAVEDWSAYIGAVPGKNHDKEWHLVKEDGSKLPRKVAEYYFPSWKELRWRD